METMSDPRVVVVVQARLGSARLPAKAFKAIEGRCLIEHVLRRAQASKLAHQVVLATTVAKQDVPLAAFAEQQLKVTTVRGSEWDVLGRFHLAAALTLADVVVRVTGDCPFLAPEVLDECVQHYFDNPLRSDYITNDTLTSGYPDGTDVEVFSRALLDVAHRQATDLADREHVTPWMRRTVTYGVLKYEHSWSHLKLSVDRPEDYEYAVRVARQLATFAAPDDYSLVSTLRAVREVEGA